MFGRYEKLLDRVTALSLEVANLKARVTELEFHDAISKAANGGEEAKPDPVQEKMNKMFAEGLENLMAYDGRPQEATVHGE